MKGTCLIYMHGFMSTIVNIFFSFTSGKIDEKHYLNLNHYQPVAWILHQLLNLCSRTHVVHVFLILAFLGIFLMWTDSSHTRYILQAFLTSQYS